MRVSPSLEMSYRRESDEAMRLAIECGVAINAAQAVAPVATRLFGI